MGWKTGFEPATSGTTIQRSNQLSYNHRLKCPLGKWDVATGFKTAVANHTLKAEAKVLFFMAAFKIKCAQF